MEKERTTPDNYPLTLNALMSACNQTTNRHPVSKLEEATVSNALLNLRGLNLVRIVYSRSNRADRFRQVLDETLALDDGEAAVVCLLMLRGPADGERAAGPERAPAPLRRPGRRRRRPGPAGPARRTPRGQARASAGTEGEPVGPTAGGRAAGGGGAVAHRGGGSGVARAQAPAGWTGRWPRPPRRSRSPRRSGWRRWRRRWRPSRTRWSGSGPSTTTSSGSSIEGSPAAPGRRRRHPGRRRRRPRGRGQRLPVRQRADHQLRRHHHHRDVGRPRRHRGHRLRLRRPPPTTASSATSPSASTTTTATTGSTRSPSGRWWARRARPTSTRRAPRAATRCSRSATPTRPSPARTATRSTTW